MICNLRIDLSWGLLCKERVALLCQVKYPFETLQVIPFKKIYGTSYHGGGGCVGPPSKIFPTTTSMYHSKRPTGLGSRNELTIGP